MSQAGYPPGMYDYAAALLKANKRISDLERELAEANAKLARLRELAKESVNRDNSADAFFKAREALRAAIGEE